MIRKEIYRKLSLNLDFAMLFKNFLVLNLALTIPGRLNGLSLIVIIVTGSSGAKVLHSCVEWINLKEDKRLHIC